MYTPFRSRSKIKDRRGLGGHGRGHGAAPRQAPGLRLVHPSAQAEDAGPWQGPQGQVGTEESRKQDQRQTKLAKREQEKTRENTRKQEKTRENKSKQEKLRENKRN